MTSAQKKSRIKDELTTELIRAVRAFSSSTRGANLLGAGAVITTVGSTIEVWIASGDKFSIGIKET